MATFETHVVLDADIEAVFDFLIRPANAVKVSPPELGLTFVKAPEVLAQGDQFEFKVHSWGQVVTLIHEITTLQRPTLYVERQVKGPFKKWTHEHHLVQEGPGKVRLTDEIEFEPPGGLIGLLVTKAKILDHLEDGFHARHRQMQKIFKK